MAEEKREKEKRGIVKLIFKWIGLGLLVVLIIGALAFDAPWKVIALLFIALAAHTILPKSAVKWFWLSAAVVVVVLIVWAYLYEGYEVWVPYTFSEELAALQAEYAVPDSENAAVAYNQLLEYYNFYQRSADYNENTVGPKISDPNAYYLTRSEPWSSKDYPRVAEWLKSQENTIAKLIEASKFEKCRFPIVASVEALSQHIKISAPMRDWAFLLVCAANNDLAEGRLDQAIEKNLTILQMAKHLCQQSADTDVLTSFAFEALSLGGINNFLVGSDATESHISKIEQTVSVIRHDLNSDIPNFIALEKLMLKNMFGGLFYEVSLNGRVRLSRDPLAMTRDRAKEKLAGSKVEDFVTISSYWFKRLYYTILCWFYAPRTPEKLSRIVDDSFEKLYMMTKPDFDWSKEPQDVPLESVVLFRRSFRRITELMAQSSENLYLELHNVYLRQSAKQRGTLLIIALRRYKNKAGHWPENLEEVKSFAPAEIFIDLINGSSFVYKLTEEDFTLYSKGKNNIDEGGKRDRWDEEKTGADDWLIWPIKSKRSTQQEVKANDEQQ